MVCLVIVAHGRTHGEVTLKYKQHKYTRIYIAIYIILTFIFTFILPFIISVIITVIITFKNIYNFVYMIINMFILTFNIYTLNKSNSQMKETVLKKILTFTNQISYYSCRLAEQSV